MKQSWPRLVCLLNEPSSTSDQAYEAARELQAQLLDDPKQSFLNLFEQLSEQQRPSSRHQEMIWDHLLQVIVRHLSQHQLWQSSYLDFVVQLYQLLGRESNLRHQLLHLCSQVGDTDCLTAIAELLCMDPPLTSTSVGVIFAPLFQDRDIPFAALFPRLLDTLEHPSVAAATLDLANHLVRTQRFSEHPGHERLDALQSLLRNLNYHMQHLAENPEAAGENAQQMSYTISESIALLIALCDTLALIGDTSSIGLLRQTLDLPHRRLRTEAAAALAKLKEPIGEETLIASAAEPVIRLHALTYAEELGLTDQIDPVYLSETAKAEGKLALWLAHEQQMGIPPTELKCVDQRSQFWPGSEQPVDCFLFRYHFQFGESNYSNLGIVGPLTRSITADLGKLPLEDVYAIFAGWQADHEDIHEQDVGELTESERIEVLRFQRALQDKGYEAIAPHTWGSFLGDHVLVADAQQKGISGVVVTDFQDVFWHPHSESPRPLTAEDVYNLYKGRKLLQAFNP